MTTAISIRALREYGIAQFTIGGATTMKASAISATMTMPIEPLRRSEASSKRRLSAEPRPVPSSSENSVTVSE